MSLTRRTLLAAVPGALAAPALHAQETPFPNRPVTLIAGGTAGGPTDVISRLVAEGMAKDLGQPVVIENIAGTVFSAGRTNQARPDGYTILNTNIGFAASATMYRRLPYSVTESFEPLGLVSEAAMTIVSRPGFPAGDIASYLSVMKREGDKLNLAHSGVGSSSHLCAMLLQQAAGTLATTVAYRGSAPITTELMAGRVDIFCDQVTNTLPYIRDKRFPAYAVTSDTRVPGLESLPTMAEAGKPEATMTTWHGLFAPVGVPEPVLDRLSAALRAALREERLRTRFAELITAPASQDRATRDFHRRYHAEEVARWRPVIQAAGTYAD
ncbi:tripartite tricarboxylate transporter substrate-binding protein [Roseomonas harenae]|uniref:tripartite tricarboxylate transporter substrate-binding protein n=1 Tax=Muricoccus harenae TaxID=2692566 RepID=UPI00133153A5|nr:tripartite tricarboxylate transporter substrate-binding protein [Roseomonas harenae]